jgi:hypothetical protein
VKDFKDYYKELLRETSEKKEEPKTSFVEDIITAVRKHVKDPSKTVTSSRGDDFDTFDKAHLAARLVQMQIEKPHDSEKHSHNKRIQYLKSILPDETVHGLLKKHFPEHHQ